MLKEQKGGGMVKLGLYPWYNTRPLFYWFLWIFVIVYIIGSFLYTALFVQNNASKYTYFKNPGMPGAELSSKRYLFVDIAVRLSIIGHVIIPALVMCMIFFKKSLGCNIFWIILFAIAFLCILVGLFGLSTDYAGCNGNNQYGNLCNSLDWCCVETVYSQPYNGCPNVLPCDVPRIQEDLNPNPDFLGLYWTGFILWFFDVVFIIVIGWHWSMDPEEDLEYWKELKKERKLTKKKNRRKRRRRQPPKKTITSKIEEEEQEEPKEEILPIPIISSSLQQNRKKTHGLRQRRE